MTTVTISLSSDELKAIAEAASSSQPFTLSIRPQAPALSPAPAPMPPPIVKIPGNGCNMRGITDMSLGEMREALDLAKALGFSYVRIYAAHVERPLPEQAGLVKKVLDELQARQLKAILCLADMAGSPYTPRGVHGTTTFYQQDYKTVYLPYVKALFKALDNHAAIFAAQVCNEAQFYPGREMSEAEGRMIVKFFEDATITIRQAHPGIVIASGSQSSWHTFVNQTNARWNEWFDLFDVIENHSHFDITHGWNAGGVMGAASDFVLQDLQRARQKGKPHWLMELGCLRQPGQSALPWLSAAIDEYKKHKGDSVAQWEFGVNDSDGYGMSRKFPDFVDLQNMWKAKNSVR